MTDDLNRQLNAIVGAALRAMAESGVPDEVLGAFAAEHRIKVASILGLTPARTESPDLVAVVEEAVERVLRRQQPGAVAIAPSAAAPVLSAKTVRKYVMVDGKRTSVTLRGETFDRLLSREGGKSKGAMRIVNELANSAPAGVPNRSSWIEQRLQALLAAQLTEQPRPAARH